MSFSKSTRWTILALVSVLMMLASQSASSSLCSSTPVFDHGQRKSEPTLDIAHAKGLLWKIEKPDIEASYIFGTIHLENPEIVALPDVVNNLLRNSRTFSMEVVLDSSASALYARRAQQLRGSRLREQTGEELYEQLVEISERDYGIAGSDINRLKPWAVFTLLSRPRPVTGNVLDTVLEGAAIRLNKPVFGLETAEELVAALDSLPLEQQIAILHDTVCHYDTLDEQIRQLTRLYQNRDLAGMVALNEGAHADETVFDSFMQRILYQRNLRMTDRMQLRLMEGGAFIAVGALHLPAEQGILSLLELRGYKVSLVY